MLLLLSRDTGLAAALLEGTFPRPLRLHMVRPPAAALAFMTDHSPDGFVLDAAVDLADGARHAPELAFRLRSRSVPLVMVTPVGRSARNFLELCRSRNIASDRCDDRSPTALAAAVRAGIERRRQRLRFAYVLSPLAGAGAAEGPQRTPSP